MVSGTGQRQRAGGDTIAKGPISLQGPVGLDLAGIGKRSVVIGVNCKGKVDLGGCLCTQQQTAQKGGKQKAELSHTCTCLADGVIHRYNALTTLTGKAL